MGEEISLVVYDTEPTPIFWTRFEKPFQCHHGLIENPLEISEIP
jgi:hypothetical protein